MVKVFLPPLDSMWETTGDWRVVRSFTGRYGNGEFMLNMGLAASASDWPHRDLAKGWNWDDQMRADYSAWVDEQLNSPQAIIPAGSIFSMERYHVSRSGEDEVTLKMYRSPRLEICPRKRGGKGKGMMRFYVSLAEFNTFPELQEFEP